MKTGVKKITGDNWLQPDPTLEAFVGVDRSSGSVTTISPRMWAELLLRVRLSPQVPEELSFMFEAARGILIYGVFFYPLYALGTAQLYRVGEAAVRIKAAELGARDGMSFEDILQFLLDAQAISEERSPWWNAIRKLRNMTSHAEIQHIHPPGDAAGTLRRVAESIEELFEDSCQHEEH